MYEDKLSQALNASPTNYIKSFLTSYFTLHINPFEFDRFCILFYIPEHYQTHHFHTIQIIVKNVL